MSATGLEVFDKTLQTTNIWLDGVMEVIGPDRHLAWHVLGSVLRIVRDRLPLGLAAHLGAELPLLVRGTYYDQWRPSEQPKKWRSLDEFYALISAELANLRPIGSDDAARAVFQVLNRHIDPGQTLKVIEALPEDVARLWLVEVEAAL